jgi:hypothetical protein
VTAIVPTVSMFQSSVVSLVFTLALGVFLAALGGAWVARIERRAVTPAATVTQASSEELAPPRAA